MKIFQYIKGLFFKHTKIFVCLAVVLCATTVTLTNLMAARSNEAQLESANEDEKEGLHVNNLSGEESEDNRNDKQDSYNKAVDKSIKNAQDSNSSCGAEARKETESKGKVLNTTSTSHEGIYKYKAYDELYPELYCTRPETQVTPNKTIFLTFDDGPSQRTAEVLDILKSNDIKATFFVTGCGGELGKKMMKRIVDEGHTLAIHTYTHDFKSIYKTVEAYLDDFNKIYTLIYETTGVKPTLFRFPGGSKNGFNKHNYREIIAEMTRRGFDYFDWNLSVGDAVSRTPTPAEKCVSNVLSTSSKCAHGVVLMHDAPPKRTTVEALPKLIEGLRQQGFKFDKLTHDIDPAPYSLARPYR